MRHLIAGLAATALIPLSAGAGPVEVGYQYELADFTGTIPYSDARVVLDPSRNEAYSVFANEVRVFNAAGMEIYGFNVDPFSVGRLLDLAVEDDGNLLLLIYGAREEDGAASWAIVRADYRGRLRGEIALDRSGAPDGFQPNRLLLRSGALWLGATTSMSLVQFHRSGEVARVVDLAEIAGIPLDDRRNAEVAGIDVDPAGNILYSVPVQFRVYLVAPDGSARSFGRAGSAAGNFGNVSGVVSDGQGHIWVSDRLRGVVMGFDSEFRFLREFGQTGAVRERLVRPGALALNPAGKLYVSQLGKRGVAVYAIHALD